MSLHCTICPPNEAKGGKKKRFYAFPSRDSPEWPIWLEACKVAEKRIQRTKNPVVCRLHYNSLINQKLDRQQETLKERGKKIESDLKLLSEHMAEWLQGLPPRSVTIENVIDEAKDLADEMNVHSLKIDFAWVYLFRAYLDQNYRGSWERCVLKRSENKLSTYVSRRERNKKVEAKSSCHQEINEEFAAKLIEKKILDGGLVENKEPKEEFPQQTVQSYTDALHKVKLLSEYVKRTDNKDAMELLQMIRKLLNNASR